MMRAAIRRIPFVQVHDGGREEPRLGDAEQETRHIELGGVVTSMVPADTRPHRIMMAAMQRRMPSL